MIRIDLSAYTPAIAEAVKDVEAFAQEVGNKIALDIYADLLRETPVDTGEARNGWALDDAANEITISNSIPYIGRLNDGHSKQAPVGFVEAIVDRHTRL